jgi:hypothetical protein
MRDSIAYPDITVHSKGILDEGPTYSYILQITCVK